MAPGTRVAGWLAPALAAVVAFGGTPGPSGPRPAAAATPGRFDATASIVSAAGTGALPADVVVVDGAGRVRATVRVAAATAGAPERAALSAAGAEITSCAGPVCAVWVAPEALEAVAAAAAAAGAAGGAGAGHARVEVGTAASPVLDVSVPLTGAVTLREELGLDGTGVIVGIIDTGCDFRHADFRNADGTSRILYYLDLSKSPEASGFPPLGPLPISFPHGTLYGRADLDRALTAEPDLVRVADTFGHGTHVASIATGGGGPEGRYVGVAPGATIICVKADRNEGFSNADLIDAMAFVFQAAGAHGLPAVSNLSVGGQGGPHDGTSNTEVALEALMGAPIPGRAIAVAAGNDGGSSIHVAGFASRTEDFEVEIRVLPYTPRPTAPRGIVLSLFAPTEADVSLTVTSPSGVEVGPVRVGEPVVIEPTGAGLITISACPDGPSSVGSRSCEIAVAVRESTSTPVVQGVWRVRLEGESAGRVDGWFGSSLTGPVGNSYLVEGIDSDNRVTSPGTSLGALCVGSYVSRAVWRRYDGEEVSFALLPGAISSFSGEGPGRGPALELFKPDFTAPGEWVIAALSSEAPPTSPGSAFFSGAPPGSAVVEDLTHAALRGTSMAAPHAAGIVALLFQEDPWLTGEEVRALLRASARGDDFSGLELPDARWGFGKVDVWNAVRMLRGDPPGALEPSASRVGTTLDLVAPGTGQPVVAYAIPADASGLPLGSGLEVAIEATAGSWAGPVEDRGLGVYARVLLPPEEGTALGDAIEARVTASVGGTVLPAEPVVWFAESRVAIGRDARVGGGGCSVSSAGAPGREAAGVVSPSFARPDAPLPDLPPAATLGLAFLALTVALRRGSRK